MHCVRQQDFLCSAPIKIFFLKVRVLSAAAAYLSRVTLQITFSFPNQQWWTVPDNNLDQVIICLTDNASAPQEASRGTRDCSSPWVHSLPETTVSLMDAPPKPLQLQLRAGPSALHSEVFSPAACGTCTWESPVFLLSPHIWILHCGDSCFPLSHSWNRSIVW